MNPSKTYYDVLGIAPDASQDEIRTAFRSAAKRHHPDRFPTYIQKVRATAKMQEINAAYAVLRNPDSRRAYDATLPKRDVSVNTSPSRGSKTQRRASEVGGAEVNAMHAPQSSRMDPFNVWMIVVWLSTSFGFGYFYWSDQKSKTLGTFLVVAAYSLVISPMVVMVVVLVLMVPIAIIWKTFSNCFESRQRAMPARKGKIVLDLLARLVGLAAVVGVGATAWHFNFTPDLLAYALLAAAGGLIGEIAAMIVYLYRRSVVHSTEMLLHTDLEPLGRESNRA